jgi:hypothetical protein
MISGSLRVTSGYSASSTVIAEGNATAAAARLNQTTASQGNTVSAPYEYGTSGSLLVNRVIVQVRQLAVSTSEELNLFDGSLLDMNGVAAPLTRIKFIQVAIVANATDGYASSATIGNAGTNPNQLWFGGTTQTQTIDRYVPFQQGDATGKTVGSGTARVKIANNDASNILWYRIVIGGNT